MRGMTPVPSASNFWLALVWGTLHPSRASSLTLANLVSPCLYWP